MSKKIKIDDDIWEAMKKLAEPLEDSPCDVLRKLLKLPANNSMAQPQSSGSPMKNRFRFAIHEAIASGSTGKQIFGVVEGKLKPHLKANDYVIQQNKQPKWKNTITWERLKMRDDGLLERDADGEWKVTPKGWAEYQNWCSVNGTAALAH